MSSRRWLAVVALGYGVVQLAFVGHVGFGWDETVYLSQVSPDVPTAYFSAPRARGITWLVAPVAAVTTSPWPVRTYLATLSPVALAAAFWPWLRFRTGATVPLAAGIFSVLWVSVFYGPQVMPNLWVAFAAVAAVGWFLRHLDAPTARAPLLGMAAGVTAAALVRPTDSLWLALPLAATAVLAARRRALLPVGVLLAALSLGWLPFVVEAVSSYGGLAARLRTASAVQGGTRPRFGVLIALRSVNGPTLCRPCTHPVPVTGGLLWLCGLVAVAVAVLAAGRDRRLRLTLLPAAAAGSLAVPYLFLVGYSAPRFLLPAYALVSLPVAEGLLAPLRRSTGRARTLATAGVAVVLLGLAAYQLLVLAAAIRGADRQRAAWADVVAALRSHGVVPPCIVTGYEAPPIGFYVRCRSRQTAGHDRSTTVAALLRAAKSVPTAYIDDATGATPGWTRHWQRIVVITPVHPYRLYLVPRTAMSAGSAVSKNQGMCG